MSKPTMADVAREAGVDVSTVSRALNERTASLLRPETVEKVMEAARSLGYRPNVLARGLRTRRSHTIGMVIPDLTNPFFPPIVRGVEDALDDEQYTVIVANTDNDPEREARVLRSLIGHQVDGLLLATSHLDDLGASADALAGLPVVLVNRRGSDDRVSAVVPNDPVGIELAVDHLVELGHTRIGHIAGPQDTSTGRARAEAFLARAPRERGSPPPVETTDVYGTQAGVEACAALLDRCPGLTAIVAANDQLAVGCLRTLRSRGLRVPEDVSLVGFNDMPMVDLLDPPLTTLRIPQYEMGRAAGRLLLDRVQAPRDEQPGPRSLELEPELIVRASTAAPTPSA
jgi:LacI family transcriptional regulator